ncbi:hypothetical protein TARUN_751 [Trichoderma arundinaceum]|uniref:DUF6594 domain-containing protein n=1 Tax=Trichoderma arundinaceum TaxID=490622 RepID=A0A395NZG2_TRIAR|nr:hypothetical protein TARUN_751 [Trichoderma arundinaceum]
MTHAPTKDEPDDTTQDRFLSPEDRWSWEDVCDLSKNGCIHLVNSRRPHTPRWLDTCINRLRGRPDPDQILTGFRVNFADMQRMYMRQLQIRLIDIAAAQQFRGADRNAMPQHELAELGPILRKYGRFDAVLSSIRYTCLSHLTWSLLTVQAVQDHEYMARFSSSPDDPFIASSERTHDDIFLTRAVTLYGKDAASIAPIESATRMGPWEDGHHQYVKPIAHTRGETQKKALLSRIWGGMIGGAFLIGPMWLLVMKQELYLSLGVTTGCVVGFGLLMAWTLGSLEAVFGATFAYAAVLMVFVGVMMQNLHP